MLPARSATRQGPSGCGCSVATVRYVTTIPARQKGDMKRLTVLLTIAVLALSAASAMASSSTCQTYNTCSTTTQTATTTLSSGSGAEQVQTTPTAATSTLPFTGMDVALLIAGGVALLGGGLVVRRLSRRSN